MESSSGFLGSSPWLELLHHFSWPFATPARSPAAKGRYSARDTRFIIFYFPFIFYSQSRDHPREGCVLFIHWKFADLFLFLFFFFFLLFCLVFLSAF